VVRTAGQQDDEGWALAEATSSGESLLLLALARSPAYADSMTTFTALTPLLQSAAAVRDTLLVRPLPPVRSAFDQVVYVASGLTSILTLLLVALLVVAAFAIRRSVQKAHAELDRRIGEFGHRVDDFNQLLGRMHTQADRVVDLASGALSTVEWGADKVKKFKVRRRRRQKEKAGDLAPATPSPSTLPDSGDASR
jgi:hypothetical protein